MNRSGSLVVQDAKGRDRERYPIVYGARLKVKEGQTGRAGPGAGRVGSVHLLDPHRGAGPDPLQGHPRRHHGARGSRRGHRPVAPHHRRLAGREEAAGGRDQGQGRQGQPQVPHAVARALDGAGRRDGVGGRRAREDSARDDQDQGHHGRSAARGRAVRSAQAARDGGHLGNRRHRQARRHRQGSAEDHHRARRAGRRAARVLRCRAACTSTCRKASASARASR